MDKTRQKIIDATMNLIMEKGYASMTTKDIAKYARVNESTLFRKFKNKVYKVKRVRKVFSNFNI